ncbi:hypothetical protein CsSME_00019202 [Camellia sinensis var. sinensis]|uniref:putative E3 ubiquitin-protein ligase XBAT35 isoform X2 n=1 Tax=Camellia sinensis TaxID=4442 RepID=UPI001035672D|nr:putative E3 ubiquitin-protein ligase XBAT35 isoform X2 [Camellia sinensis]
MDGGGRGRGRWKNLKQRLGLKGMGFCGSPWSVGAFEMEDALEQQEPVSNGDVGGQISAPPPCVGQIPATGMNLATALAAERNLRPAGPTIDAAATTNGGTMPTFTQLRSLMGLFEETDGEDRKRREREKERGGGIDEVCCVCMERNKGAAFIPCGHTYCRVCSREVWLNRGSCPLCNRSITEILDIF